jgi:N-acyl-D-amino-acid deacylase
MWDRLGGVVLLTAALTLPASILILGGTVYDGLGNPGVRADVRIVGERIAAVGKLTPAPGETVLDARGMAVAPGFIDAHSHADGGIVDDPLAESQIRQGITTAIVGQDGGGAHPITDLFSTIERAKPALNFAAFAGHGVIRRSVMGDGFKRAARPDEIASMRRAVASDMMAGAIGVSTGLEYDPGFYSTTEELIEVASVAAQYGGVYASHVRDEGNGVMDSLREVIRIAKDAGIPAHISHIKLATHGVWGKADAALSLLRSARDDGLDITADVYPYTYWQSTITVLTLEKNWEDRAVWERALSDVGGPRNVMLSQYTPNAAWEGKTLEEIARGVEKDAIWVIQEIISKTHGPNAVGRESIVCTAMAEHDLRMLMFSPLTMFCSDGAIGGSHPRGAGAFPRFFARYVRQQGTLRMETAVWKATGFPATRFGLHERGAIAVGRFADVFVFDAQSLEDRSSTKQPKEFAVGAKHLLVNGTVVLRDGKMTGARPGKLLRRQASRM